MMAIRKIIIAGIILALVIGTVFVAGCARSREREGGALTGAPSVTSSPTRTSPLPAATTPTAHATTTVQSGGLKTCAQHGGTVTTARQNCPGKWLAASDTFSCCSVAPAGGAAPAAVLTIEPFTVSPENEDLGSITG
jgi:hypothetical protein